MDVFSPTGDPNHEEFAATVFGQPQDHREDDKGSEDKARKKLHRSLLDHEEEIVAKAKSDEAKKRLQKFLSGLNDDRTRTPAHREAEYAARVRRETGQAPSKTPMPLDSEAACLIAQQRLSKNPEDATERFSPRRAPVQRKSTKALSPTDVNYRDPNNHKRTQLHVAVLDGDILRVQRLLKDGADPSILDSQRQTPLFIARLTQQMDIYALLDAAIRERFNPQSATG